MTRMTSQDLHDLTHFLLDLIIQVSSLVQVRIWINNCIQEFQWNILSIYELTSKMV